MRLFSAVAAIVIFSISYATAAPLRTLAGTCTQRASNGACAKCEFNTASQDVPINTVLSYTCPRMTPGALVKARIVVVSTMRSANGAGTWVNWDFAFMGFSTVITAAGQNVETRTVETFPFSSVPRNGLALVTVRPSFSQFGNAQGPNAPATLNPGSSLTICDVAQVAC